MDTFRCDVNIHFNIRNCFFNARLRAWTKARQQKSSKEGRQWVSRWIFCQLCYFENRLVSKHGRHIYLKMSCTDVRHYVTNFVSQQNLRSYSIFFSFQFAWCFVLPINNRSLIRSQHFFKNYNILITIQEIHKCDSERPQPMPCIISFYSMAYEGLSPAVRSQSFTSRKREPIWTTIMKWNRFISNKFNVITKIEAKTSQMQI